MEIDLEHLAFSILHGTFDPQSPGGCSCQTCNTIYRAIQEQASKADAEYFQQK